MVEPKSTQSRHVVENCRRVETELGDDFNSKSCRLRGRDFLGHCVEKLIVADTRMALRIASNPERADAAAAEKPAVDGIGGAPERSACLAVAGDDENALHIGFAVQAGDEIVQRMRALEISHRDMRHRLEARGAQTLCRSNGLFGGLALYRAEVNPRAAPQYLKRRDVGIARSRRLN